jgi:hypothetical protein
VHLQRKSLACVKNFDQQWKPRRVCNVPENFVSTLRPEFVQRRSLQGPFSHHTLCFSAIDNFPRLTNVDVGREVFTELGFKAPATPHPLDENRLEGKRTVNGKFLIAACGFQISKFVGRFCETPSIFASDTDAAQRQCAASLSIGCLC